MTTTLIQSMPPAGSSAHLKLYNPTTKIMALDTIKTKHHKTFPFTSPTITKNPPSQTVILEILFSSDDVNSAGADNTHGEEGVEEEDDNDGDSDYEDDVNSNSDGMSNVDSGDDSDEDDEEDEEDEDDEEEDSDEEDDDGEHEFDESEDFVNDFDKDLIIDFGDDENENEDDDDQLVIEFEEPSPPSTPRKKSVSPPTTNPIPFWFTHEEPGMPDPLLHAYHRMYLLCYIDQIRMIFESYALTLDLEKQRKACIRSPAVCFHYIVLCYGLVFVFCVMGQYFVSLLCWGLFCCVFIRADFIFMSSNHILYFSQILFYSTQQRIYSYTRFCLVLICIVAIHWQSQEDPYQASRV